MLIHMSFKRVVDFHGHLCPDLVIGGKLCEQVQTLLAADGRFPAGLCMVAENRTSALDAVQILLGLTVGNQRLHVVDYGKHNYTVVTREKNKGYRLTMRRPFLGDETAYRVLACKIADDRAGLEEVVQFQRLSDERVAALLDMSAEELFRAEETHYDHVLPETAGVYFTCSRCGQPVLKSHMVHHGGNIFCIPCFRGTGQGWAGYTIH